MGDYKEMENARTYASCALTVSQAVRAAVAAHANEFMHITGTLPLVTGHEGTYTISVYGAGVLKDVASFSLRQLPGCCGILVFYHASVAKDFRDKGLGSLLLQIRERAAILANYTVVMATVLDDNEAEKHILRTNNWNPSYGFKNLRTGNDVSVLYKTLKRS